jgi:hypothetical protein
MRKQILYVKANSIYYYPTAVKERSFIYYHQSYIDECSIKKISGGRIQIDYFDQGLTHDVVNKKPNCQVIISPAGLQEIKYYLSDEKTTK